MPSSFRFAPSRVLCPVDYSDLSSLALKYAAAAAHEYGAELIVLHAATFELPRYFVQSEMTRLAHELRAARSAAGNLLSHHVNEVLGKAVERLGIGYEVLDTHPLDAILDTAEKKNVGLIVLGTHGYSGVKRLVLGSVAENVMRNATSPVFLVRQKEHEFIDLTRTDLTPRLEHILCPTKMVTGADTGLQHAVSLAERFRARVTVLYSMEDGLELDESTTKKRLCDLISDSVSTGCSLEPIVRKGNPAEEIISYARQEEVDLIVVCALHRPFQEGTFFGKTTELVVRHAPVPVLVVPLFPSNR
jgi:nucleotide-binding universal stress UspA family protein